MSTKTRDNLGKIVLVLLIITAILAATLISFNDLAKGQSGYAEAVADTTEERTEAPTALVVTDSGKVGYQIPSQSEAEDKGYVWVTTYEALKTAINANNTICLGADITYTATPSNSSGNFAPNAFTGVLDGNGHTITINADESSGAVSKPASNAIPVVNDNYRTTDYRAYSYFIPYNKGTIKNTNFVFTSNHDLTGADGSEPGASEYHFKANSDTYKVPSAGGIITGINDGTISNVSLDVKGQFAFGHNPSQGADSAVITVSTVVAGGVAGATLGNSVIEYSSVNINPHAKGAIVGKHTISYGNGKGRALAAAGGFVGNICQYKSGDRTAKFTNNVLTGTGDVVAYSTGRQWAGHFFAGGYIASSFVLSDTTQYRTIDMTTADDGVVNKQKNPIRGLISSWTGVAKSRGIASNATDIARRGGLFDYVGDASTNIFLAYDHAAEETSIDNPHNAGWYIDTEISGSTVPHITSWSEAYSTTGSGKVYLAYELDAEGNYTDYVKVAALADGADKTVPEIGQYLSEKEGNRYIDLPAMVDGHVINSNITQAKMVYSATVYANGTPTYDCHPGNFYGGFVRKIGETWLNDVSYEIQFGELIDYEIIGNDGNKITVGSTAYTGNHIAQMPKAKFLSAYNSLVGDLTPTGWKITRTPYYMGNTVPNAKDVLSLQETYLTGEYSFYPITKVIFSGFTEQYTFAYLDTTKNFVSRLNINNNYKHSVNPVEITASLQEKETWANQATFNISLTTNAAFNAYRVYRNNTPGEIIRMGKDVTSAEYIDTTTTGSIGAAYRFAVYKTIDDEDVILGQTHRNDVGITAKIDNVKPVFREVNVYEYDDTKTYNLGKPLEQSNWYNRKIAVEYIVDDDDRSGISAYHVESSGNSDAEVIQNIVTRIFVYLDYTSSVKITITDNTSNSAEITDEYNIDTVNLTIGRVQTSAQNEPSYNEAAAQVIRIYIDEDLGASGWKGYYQAATPGTSIDEQAWIETDISDLLGRGTLFSFNIDFSLDNKLIYFKFVNDQGLFEDVVSNGIGPYPPDESVGWTLKLAYGHLKFTRGQVYIDSTSIADMTDEEIFNALKKDYDGSTDCRINFDFADTDYFKQIVEFENNNLPDTSLLKKDNFEIIANYNQSNAGETYLTLSIRGKNQFKDLFIVTIDDHESITLNTRIDKLTIEYDIASDSKEVRYGDEVPTSKEISVEVSGKTYTFALKFRTDREITDIGEYNYYVDTDDYDNFIISVIGEHAVIKVNPKERMIYTELDGKRNHGATMAYDQQEHFLKAYYIDLNGNVIECVSMLTEQPTSANNIMRNVGQYTYEFTIADSNYTISDNSSNSRSVFTIQPATMPIKTGIQEVQYDSLAQVFKPIIPDYAKGNLKLTYYPVTGATVDDKGNISGNVGQSIDPSQVTETGYYKVAVEYTLSSEETLNYYACEIEDGWLIINKAPVEFHVQEKRVTYTGESFTMELSEGIGNDAYYFARLFVTTANGEKIPYVHTDGASSDITITSKVKGEGIGAPDEWKEDVHYIKAGEYEYKVSFEGTSNYTDAEAIVKLVIAPATFKGITFNSQTFDYDASSERSISVDLPAVYNNAKVVYTSTGTMGSSNTPIKRTNAGTYSIKAIISMENYSDLTISADMVINKAKFANIYAESKEVVYDGTTHEVVLVGVDKYRKQGVNVVVNAMEGTSASRAGTYIAAYLISANNYETLTIETSLIIKPKEVDVNYQSIIDKSIDSATDISELTVSYTDPLTGEVKEAKIEIYDSEGNIVDTTVTKKLKAGEYTARIKMPDSDYIASNQSSSITFTVEKASNLLPILVIGGAAVLVIGLIVIIIVVASKKKGGKRRV